MRGVAGLACAFVVLASQAAAGDCPHNPQAIGTSRILVLDPTEHTRLGTMQYRETLPLADKEVVLTFDDGPLPPYTNRLLAILASECVKATFFVVGQMARANPEVLRQVHRAGHTIGTHSHSHPMRFDLLDFASGQQEIERGIAATAAALGDGKPVAPFFRFPGLGRTSALENYLASRSLMTWSVDVPSDDWRRVGADEVVRRSIARLESKRKGIILLHDIQPVTVLALPHLLRELKARGYRIVHVVPAAPGRPKTVTEPNDWVARLPVRAAPPRQAWPRVTEPSVPAPDHFVDPFGPSDLHLALGTRRTRRTRPSWPRLADAGQDMEATLPAPALENFVLEDFRNSAVALGLRPSISPGVRAPQPTSARQAALVEEPGIAALFGFRFFYP
jgi:peptidoglycan/xylan/chitin deacetylase (PgdA/CDA1 family)